MTINAFLAAYEPAKTAADVRVMTLSGNVWHDAGTLAHWWRDQPEQLDDADAVCVWPERGEQWDVTDMQCEQQIGLFADRGDGLTYYVLD
jgi:hypothetical protein